MTIMSNSMWRNGFLLSHKPFRRIAETYPTYPPFCWKSVIKHYTCNLSKYKLKLPLFDLFGIQKAVFQGTLPSTEPWKVSQTQ